jgi:hypothetical protein
MVNTPGQQEAPVATEVAVFSKMLGHAEGIYS